MIKFVMATPRSGGITWPTALTRHLYLANKTNLLIVEEYDIDKYIETMCDDMFINYAYDESLTEVYKSATQYEKVMMYNDQYVGQSPLYYDLYIDMSKPGKVIEVRVNDSFALRSDKDVLDFLKTNKEVWTSATEVKFSSKLMGKYFIDRCDYGEHITAIKQPKFLKFNLLKDKDDSYSLVPSTINRYIDASMIIR